MYVYLDSQLFSMAITYSILFVGNCLHSKEIETLIFDVSLGTKHLQNKLASPVVHCRPSPCFWQAESHRRGLERKLSPVSRSLSFTYSRYVSSPSPEGA